MSSTYLQLLRRLMTMYSCDFPIWLYLQLCFSVPLLYRRFISIDNWNFSLICNWQSFAKRNRFASIWSEILSRSVSFRHRLTNVNRSIRLDNSIYTDSDLNMNPLTKEELSELFMKLATRLDKYSFEINFFSSHSRNLIKTSFEKQNDDRIWQKQADFRISLRGILNLLVNSHTIIVWISITSPLGLN